MGKSPIAEYMDKNGRLPDSVIVSFAVLNKCGEIISRLPASAEVRQILDALDMAIPAAHQGEV